MSFSVRGLPPIAFRAVQDGYPCMPPGMQDSTDLPPSYRSADLCYEAARLYLDSVVPGVEVEAVSNKGTTAVVMGDGTYAYKVFRHQNRDYTSVENEAAALHIMGNEGVAPRLVALLDAAVHHRYAGRSCNSVPKAKKDFAIPYIEGSGALPVIITELRELVHITEIPSRLLFPEFRRIAAAMVSHSMLIADGEIMYDPARQQAVAVDWGYSGYLDSASMESDKYPTELAHEAALIRDAFVRFCPDYSIKPSFDTIANRLAIGGIASLDTLLYEHCGK